MTSKRHPVTTCNVFESDPFYSVRLHRRRCMWCVARLERTKAARIRAVVNVRRHDVQMNGFAGVKEPLGTKTQRSAESWKNNQLFCCGGP